MSILPLLIGVVLAAMIFCAFLWQVYRAVTLQGLLRWNAAGLALGTLALMGFLSTEIPILLIFGTAASLILAPVAIWADPRWSKLLPAVQLAMALYILYQLFLNPNLPTAVA